ncbi:MAG TPA: carbohydrate-binding family 9-like protein, partial [Anaeromyxobacteraceae bacterium]
ARSARAAAAVVLAAALAAAAACRDPTAGPGWLSGTRPPLPTYRAKRARGPITVDGRLDEQAWAGAPRVELVETLTGRAPRYATRARLLWDDEALYVAFECRDDEVWVRPGRKDDDAIWEDEVVEVFLDPGGAGHDYVEVEVSPANVRFDARFARPRSDLAAARAFSSGARTAVAVDGALSVGGGAPAPARGWTVELAVPWRTLGVDARVGRRWRMNLYRLETHNRAGVVEGSGFSPPLRGDFHALDRFGWLELAE